MIEQVACRLAMVLIQKLLDLFKIKTIGDDFVFTWKMKGVTIKTIPITSDSKEIFNFLGLSLDEFYNLKNLDDVIKFIKKSKFYNTGALLACNRFIPATLDLDLFNMYKDFCKKIANSPNYKNEYRFTSNNKLYEAIIDYKFPKIKLNENLKASNRLKWYKEYLNDKFSEELIKKEFPTIEPEQIKGFISGFKAECRDAGNTFNSYLLSRTHEEIKKDLKNYYTLHFNNFVK